MSPGPHRLSDAEIADCIRDERRFNEQLRKRRAAFITNGETRDIIAHYDQLIYGSDRRMINMYSKSRRCCNTDGEM